jgi:hypothetical protein
MAITPQLPKKPPLNFRDYLRKRYEAARMAIQSTIIDQSNADSPIDLVQPYAMSKTTLGRYVTLDFPHIMALRALRSIISRYAEDRTRLRPLNIMMRAEPGSGKSHLVKCLARTMRGQSASAVDYNMASLQSIEDLIQPLDTVRNLKVQDQLPILFLDEFDSDPSRYPLLLPLLWDGELNIAHRNLKVGKLVIILAGSGDGMAHSYQWSSSNRASCSFRTTSSI